MIGVVVALPTEIAPALRGADSTLRIVQGRPVHETPGLRIIVSGVGPRRAAAAVRILLDSGPLQALVSAGFAGALVPDLPTGTLVAGGSVPGHPADEALRARVAAGIRSGDCAPVDAVLNDAAGKAELAGRTGAVVVDMESGAVGAAAHERGLPFLCVKSVLDTPDAPLASSYDGCLRIATALLLHPRGVARDARRSREASESLASFFRPLLAAR